jgi:3-oxoacyl-[acyl-carrier protein] reductase
MRLEGRTAIVTGGSKGIGLGIAIALAREGADVALTYASDTVGAAEAIRVITDLGRNATAIQADIGDPEAITRLFQEATDALGPADILVNNAGITAFGPLSEATAESFAATFNVNVRGPLLSMQAFALQAPAQASIINITSASTADREPGSALYITSKTALTALTELAATEYAPLGIRVNAIAPTATTTERTQQFSGTAMETAMINRIPLKRLGTPADIGRAVVFLASEEASFITGDTLWVSGGQH